MRFLASYFFPLDPSEASGSYPKIYFDFGFKLPSYSLDNFCLFKAKAREFVPIFFCTRCTVRFSSCPVISGGHVGSSIQAL